MSAHAESHHGNEAGHEGNDSAVDELMSGIGKIVNSVRVGFKNLWKGITGTLKDFAGSSEGGHGGGHSVHEGHEAHAAGHGDGHH
ncbi:MAG TPA: hypothetical protein VI588_03535 [Candidatus Gracilibacteria bacterium]|nr:hypothetical protein [Candidatus Gracilibacteria bacterium]